MALFSSVPHGAVMWETIFAGLIDGVSGLPVNGSCVLPGGAIRVSFGFELTAATIDPTPIEGPIVRPCGGD